MESKEQMTDRAVETLCLYRMLLNTRLSIQAIFQKLRSLKIHSQASA